MGRWSEKCQHHTAPICHDDGALDASGVAVMMALTQSARFLKIQRDLERSNQRYMKEMPFYVYQGSERWLVVYYRMMLFAYPSGDTVKDFATEDEAKALSERLNKLYWDGHFNDVDTFTEARRLAAL